MLSLDVIFVACSECMLSECKWIKYGTKKTFKKARDDGTWRWSSSQTRGGEPFHHKGEPKGLKEATLILSASDDHRQKSWHTSRIEAHLPERSMKSCMGSGCTGWLRGSVL